MSINRSTFGVDVSVYVGIHFLFLGFISWISGQPFLMPSLGPSIFLLATLPDNEMNFPRRIIGGQFIGAVAGLLAFRVLIGDPTAIASTPPGSLKVLAQVFAAFVAAMLTTAGMYVADMQHPPAYATTLIISSGLLPDAFHVLVFMIAVLVMVTFHELIKRSSILDLPYEYNI